MSNLCKWIMPASVTEWRFCAANSCAFKNHKADVCLSLLANMALMQTKTISVFIHLYIHLPLEIGKIIIYIDGKQDLSNFITIIFIKV